MKTTIQQEIIEQNIFLIRRHRVMLSIHLAELYIVEVRSLVQAVKRNISRFPKDFMFQLSDSEFKNLKSQIVISSWGGIRRANPYAFTEQGVAMLSSVLKSKRAIQVNIAIMRIFVKLRQFFFAHKELAHKLSQLERKIEKHDTDIHVIFEAIRQLMAVPEKSKQKIGFHMFRPGLNIRPKQEKN
ncbi:MAG: ORF6N domain-containing protein [Candidatus Omnitrophica bacterium]|nr:ORF6N domain-containing protein [Candidatus Omnitrophota bacterium]